MLAEVVVGLLVSALAAGMIIILRAWTQSRTARVREVPPLFVASARSARVEPVIGSAIPRSPASASLRPSGPNGSYSANGHHSTIHETLIFDDSRVVDDERPEMGQSETVKFRRPGEEPVQILPGRLEVLAGEPKHREIRFVRAAGEPAELILGREPGKSPQTVALNSDTVSRRHARFAYANGRWAVANLSRTNPVVVNDEPMNDANIERPLADGDRLELGEVILRFRSR